MSSQPQPTLGEAAKTALEYRLRNGLPLDAPCDIYELIVRQGVELRFMEVKSSEGFYLSDGTAGQINRLQCRIANNRGCYRQVFLWTARLCCFHSRILLIT